LHGRLDLDARRFPLTRRSGQNRERRKPLSGFWGLGAGGTRSEHIPRDKFFTFPSVTSRPDGTSNRLQKEGRKEGKTMECSDYQQLFEASLSARKILNERRAEIFRSPSVLEATVDEVLRSQVKYAQAYATLRNHVHGCLTCQLDSNIA
jgi:hypothetical protein